MQRWTCAALPGLALLLGGCGSWPAREPLPLSQALAPADAAATPLARVATASTPPEAQGRSGFHLLATGEYALQPVRGGDFGDFGSSIGRLHIQGAAVERHWLLVGSVNLDGRSAILNPELALNIDCPPRVADALAALGREPWSTMYP